MRITRPLILLAFACAMLGMAGCGSDPEYLVAIQISPASGTAVSGSANDTVQFSAVGWYAQVYCGTSGCYPGDPDKHHTLTNADWSSSDSVNTIDTSGLATCTAPSSTPATITAKAPGGYYGPIVGTATLVCN